MPLKKLKLSKLNPSKMKIELNEDDLEMQPAAKRTKIEIKPKVLKIKKQVMADETNVELKINKTRRLRSSNKIIEARPKSARIKAFSNKINEKTVTSTKSQEIDNFANNSDQSEQELIKIEQKSNNVIQEAIHINQENISNNQLQLNLNHSTSTPEIIDIKSTIPQTVPETIRVKEEPKNNEIINISSGGIEIKPLKIPKVEVFDTSFEIIELKLPKKEEKVKKYPKSSKKQDPERTFGMLPIRDIDELFIDLPGGFNQLNEELDYHPTIVIPDEPVDHQQIIIIDDEVSDNEDCAIMTFKCDVCQKSLKSAQALKSHKGNHKFKCRHCKMWFRKESQLIRHVRDYHQSPNSFQCDICHKKFNRQYCVEMHKRRVHEANRQLANKCPICGYECDSAKRFRKHQKTHQVEDVKIKIEKKPKIEIKLETKKKPKVKQEFVPKIKKLKVEVKVEKKVFEFKAVKKIE